MDRQSTLRPPRAHAARAAHCSISLLMRGSGLRGLLWALMRLTSLQQHTKVPVGQHVSHVQAVAKWITTLRTKQARQEKECGSAPEIMVSVGLLACHMLKAFLTPCAPHQVPCLVVQLF